MMASDQSLTETAGDQRIFVAIELSDVCRDRLWALGQSWREQVTAIRWLDARTYHITLAFLGDQSATALSELSLQLTAELADSASFECQLRRIAVFPRRSPRVVALALESSRQLTDLFKRVQLCCAEPLPDDSFHPHITVGRIRRHTARSELVGLERALDVKLPVESVAIFRSHLTPQGAEYQVINRFILNQKAGS
jgi:2'-5' RNA ligase